MDRQRLYRILATVKILAVLVTVPWLSTIARADEYDSYVARFAESLPFRVYYGKVHHNLPMARYGAVYNGFYSMRRLNGPQSSLADQSYYLDSTCLQARHYAYVLYIARPVDTTAGVVFELPDHRVLSLAPNRSARIADPDSARLLQDLITDYRGVFMPVVENSLPDLYWQPSAEFVLGFAVTCAFPPVVSLLNDDKWGTWDWVLGGVAIESLIEWAIYQIKLHDSRPTTGINELRRQLRAWDAVETQRRLKMLGEKSTPAADSSGAR